MSSREFDPRIHFYANAGVFESDVLDIDWLSWEELDASLQKAAELFVAKDLRIDGKQVRELLRVMCAIDMSQDRVCGVWLVDCDH